MTDPLARAMVALDPGRVVCPRMTPDRDQPDIVRDWLAHLEAGRLGHAPRPPADRAGRDAWVFARRTSRATTPRGLTFA